MKLTKPKLKQIIKESLEDEYKEKLLTIFKAGNHQQAIQLARQVGVVDFLAGAKLTFTNLKDINLEGLNLSGANLLGSALTYANLTDANLTDRNSHTKSSDISVLMISSSFIPFLKDFSPLPKSPISREILPPPPNRTSTTTKTTSQCQMLNVPIPVSQLFSGG